MMTKRLSDSKVSSMVISDYIPNGATVTPVDDYTIWLRCADLSNTYGSLANVIADTTAMETLCNNINALRYMVRGEDTIMPAVLANSDWVAELKSGTYSTTVPTMTSNTTPSGSCIASRVSGVNAEYKAFDSNPLVSSRWVAADATATTDWVGYVFENAVDVFAFTLRTDGADSYGRIKNFKLEYSNDGSSWANAESFYHTNTTNEESFVLETSVGSHKYWRIYVIDYWQTSTGIGMQVSDLRFIGLDLS